MDSINIFEWLCIIGTAICIVYAVYLIIRIFLENEKNNISFNWKNKEMYYFIGGFVIFLFINFSIITKDSNDNNTNNFPVNNIGIPINQSCNFLSNNFGLATVMWDEKNRIGVDDYYCTSNNYDSRTWGSLPNDMSNISYSVAGRHRIGKEFVIHLNYHYGSNYTSYAEDFYLGHFKEAISDLITEVFWDNFSESDKNEIFNSIKNNNGIIKYIDDHYLVILSDTDYWPSGKGYSQFFKIVEKSFCKNHNNCNTTYY